MVTPNTSAPQQPDITSVVPDVTSPRFNTATLAQQVYEHLRRDILANQFPPDTALPEEALAGKLNVSRAPVREALRRLAAEGLVTLVPRQGAMVRSLSPREFLAVYQVREALEVLAIRLATPRLDSANLAELERLHREMARHAAQQRTDAFFAANAAFHALFVERSGNATLREIYHPLVDQLRRYYMPSLYLRGGMERSVEEHRAILQAVRDGDAERAAHLLSEHIRMPQRVLETDSEVELVPLRASNEL